MRNLSILSALMLAITIASCAAQEWERAGEETQEAAGATWDATAKTASEAWEETKEVFVGEMSDAEEAAYENCVNETKQNSGMSQEEAEHECWRRMKDEIYEEGDLD